MSALIKGVAWCCLPCSYIGEKLLEQKVEVLLEACWQPQPPGTFPDRPQSPGRRANGAAAGGGGAAPSRPSGYVAPHLRGSAGAAYALAPFTPQLCHLCQWTHAPLACYQLTIIPLTIRTKAIGACCKEEFGSWE